MKISQYIIALLAIAFFASCNNSNVQQDIKVSQDDDEIESVLGEIDAILNEVIEEDTDSTETK